MVNYMKKGLKGFSLVFIVTILGAIVGYLFRLVLARNLSVGEYGLFYSIFALFSIIFLFRSLGLEQALYKFIPEFLVKKKNLNLKYTLTFSLIITVIVSFVIFLAILIFSKTISNIYLKQSGTEVIVILMALMFFFFSIDALIVTIFAAYQKHKTYSLFQFARQLLVLVFTGVLFIFTKNLFVLVTAYIMTSILLMFAFIFTFRKIFVKFKFITLKRNKTLEKKLFKYGTAMIFVSLGGFILQFTDTILLTAYLDVISVGIYNAALPIANLLLYFGTALTVILIPLASELWAKKMKSDLNKGISLIIKYSFFIIVPLCFLIIIFTPQIINMLFGSEYILGATALKILVFGTFFYVLAQISFSIFSAIDKPAIVAKLTIAGSVFNILLGIILIPIFGIEGAAITTAAGYLLMAIFSVLFLKKRLNFTLPYISIIKSIIISGMMAGIVLLLKNALDLNLIVELIILSMIATIVYIALSFAFKQIRLSELKDILSLLKHEKK